MLSRLEHNGGSHWSLAVKINDGSATVDVDISDQVKYQYTFIMHSCFRMCPCWEKILALLKLFVENSVQVFFW